MNVFEVICFYDPFIDKPAAVNHSEIFSDIDMAIAYADYWELNMLEQHPECVPDDPEDKFDTYQRCGDGIEDGKVFAADFTMIGMHKLRETVEDLAEIAELI